jgi:hypothetical protein
MNSQLGTGADKGIQWFCYKPSKCCVDYEELFSSTSSAEYG